MIREHAVLVAVGVDEVVGHVGLAPEDVACHEVAASVELSDDVEGVLVEVLARRGAVERPREAAVLAVDEVAHGASARKGDAEEVAEVASTRASSGAASELRTRDLPQGCARARRCRGDTLRTRAASTARTRGRYRLGPRGGASGGAPLGGAGARGSSAPVLKLPGLAGGARVVPRCWLRLGDTPSRRTPPAPGGCARAASGRALGGLMRARSSSLFRSRKLSLYAHELRSAPTWSEQLLWARLSGSQLGVGFRRQLVIGPYIVDFAAPAVRLVVEVEGGYHAERGRADARRDRALGGLGWRVLRVQAELVERDIEVAVERIAGALR